MSAIAGRVRRYLDKMPAERRLGLRRRIQNAHSLVLFRALGGLVNRLRGPLHLALRPGTDWLTGDVDAARLRAAWTHRSPDNVGDLVRLYALAMNVREVLKDGVPGDFAELGVFRGNSAKVLRELIGRRPRRLFLFDTFSGFDARDLAGTDAAWSTHEFTDTSLEGVRRFVGDDGVVYVPGRFPDSLTEEARNARYAVVHIDCDLKAPAKAALAFFHPRMSPGGLIVMHDYANPYFPGIPEAFAELAHVIPERPIVLPDQAGTALLRITGPSRGT